LAAGPSLIWRLPLLLLLVALGLWFGFRGLVHLAFLFDAHPVGTFLFAPALLPFAASPALCFLLYARLLPAYWRTRGASSGRRLLAAAGGPVAACFSAQMLDLVQINLIRLMGIPLPRLPFDPY
jgi:hypothetical protein